MSINWKEIWEVHAVGFDGRYAHIPLGPDRSFPLLPGAGFGDLSHPTTSLVLSLMRGLVEDKIVVDIGTGSGILAIAAALLGAKAVYAFEIDPDAILHAKENFALNKLDIPINKIPPSFDTLLLNMISSEQAAALKQYPFLADSSHTLITSGLLLQEEAKYLSSLSHYTPLLRKEKGEWLALTLQSQTPLR